MCSFRSLAAAQRLTPVSRLNLFLQEYSPQKRSKYGEQSVFLPVLTEKRRNSLKYRLQSAMLFYILPLCGEARGKEGQSVEERRLSRVRRIG